MVEGFEKTQKGAMAALQAFFAGLILQNLVQKNRQDFEMELLRVSEQKRQKLADSSTGDR